MFIFWKERVIRDFTSGLQEIWRNVLLNITLEIIYQLDVAGHENWYITKHSTTRILQENDKKSLNNGAKRGRN